MNAPVLILPGPPLTVRDARTEDGVALGTLYSAACSICGNWQVVQIGTRPHVAGTSHFCPTAHDGAPAIVVWT